MKTLHQIFEEESINIWNDFIDDDLDNVLECIKQWLKQPNMSIEKALEEL